tara:strand:+ start:8178 stop:8705 length:528 start_codon:yes stop_codon:yes gene_type:complete
MNQTKLVIGFSGKKRSGKTEASKAILRAFPSRAVRISLADPMKDAVALIAQPVTSHNKSILRPVLQTYGEAMKQLYGFDHWVKKATARWGMLQKNHDIMICDDIRFPFEVEWIHSLGGKVIMIRRASESSGDTHISETSIDDIRPDYIIDNDCSSMELSESVMSAFKDYEASIRV